MNRISFFLLGSAVLSRFAVPINKVQAQEKPLGALVSPAGVSTHFFRIQNVKSSVMAWWLDGAHNEMPLEFQASEINEKEAPSGYKPQNDPAKPLGDFKLPDGVTRIVAIDPQNRLIVYGTDAGVKELEKSIELLDKPARQVEVEVEFVQIGGDEMKGLGLLKDPALQYSGNLTAEVAPSNINSRITDLMAQGKAQIITSPRVTAINGLTASLYSTTTGTAALGFREDDGQFRDVLGDLSEDSDSKLELVSDFGITVTPTWNDDSVGLWLAEGRNVRLKSGGSTDPLLNRHIGGVHNIGNIKDGEIIALVGGGTNRISLVDPQVADKSAANLLILVKTKKVVHGDD